MRNGVRGSEHNPQPEAILDADEKAVCRIFNGAPRGTPAGWLCSRSGRSQEGDYPVQGLREEI